MSARTHASLALAVTSLAALLGVSTGSSCSTADATAGVGPCADAGGVPVDAAAVPDGAVPCPMPNQPSAVTLATLPAGRPCAADAPICNFSLTSTCDAPRADDPGTTNVWSCVCKDATWDCVFTFASSGGSSCDDEPGPPCGRNLPYSPPEISEGCTECVYRTIEGGLDPCFAAHCEGYFSCRYCGCFDAGADAAACREACDPRPPACEDCYAQYAERANGPCAATCITQPFRDAGFVDAAANEDAP